MGASLGWTSITVTRATVEDFQKAAEVCPKAKTFPVRYPPLR